MSLVSEVVWNVSAFDDLKTYCHKNNDFIRDVSSILIEKAKLEQVYADGLSKITVKARKLGGDVLGSLRASWDAFSTQINDESDIHRELGNKILEEVAKPLKEFADKQREDQKPAELEVEKARKTQIDKRNKEAQARKTAYVKAKEAENLIAQVESSRAKALDEKELTKLDAKCYKADESVEKADLEYISKLIDAERGRLALDTTITKSTNALQDLEEKKLEFMKDSFINYTNLFSDTAPKLDESLRTLTGTVQGMCPESDIKELIETRGPPRQPAEQIIFSCYEEDLSNPFDNARRKFALENKLKKVLKALQSESMAREGLNKLCAVYSDNPNFSSADGQEDVSSQVRHSNAVIDLLDASVYRLGAALGRLGQYEAPHNPLSQYIEEKRDRGDLSCCLLRVPLHEVGIHHPANYDHLVLTDTSNILTGLYDDFDEADDFDFDVDAPYQEVAASAPPGYTSVDICKVDYEYVGQEQDELTINPGDVITLLERHDDGWWKGELRGKQGVFPASYVHML